MPEPCSEALKPDLLVLDEFQKFADLIKPVPEGADADHRHLLDPWFYGNSPLTKTPVLLLSATPYRLYAPDHEDPSGTTHLRDFKGVLQFLRGVPAEDAWFTQLQSEFVALRQGLEQLAKGRADHEALRKHKLSIEARLQPLMCRTERNWYYQDERKGIEEVPPRATATPTQAELDDLAACLRG